MINMISSIFGGKPFNLSPVEKEITEIETHLHQMLEDSNAFADSVSGQHVKQTTVALAKTVAELGGLYDERNITDIS